MSDDRWTPFGMDEDEAERYKVLVDGVPSWMLEPLLSWLQPCLTSDDKQKLVWCRLARDIELITRIPVGLADRSIFWDDYAKSYLRPLDGQQLLAVVDAILSGVSPYGIKGGIDRLNKLLEDGKSKWQVGERLGKPGLVERVPEGVQDMVEHAIANAGDAGKILAQAWGKAYGSAPDYSGAYFDAICAVECAARPIVSPKDNGASLAKMAGEIAANKEEWSIATFDEQPDPPGHRVVPTGTLLADMMTALGQGQKGRHGQGDAGELATKTGVVLAATLVSWFSSGAVTRKQP